MEKVYLIEGESGQYDDYTSWVEGIFTDECKALDYLRMSFNNIEIYKNTNESLGTLYNGTIHHGDDNYPSVTYYSIIEVKLNPVKSEFADNVNILHE